MIYGNKEDATHAAINFAKTGLEHGTLRLWDGHISPNEDAGRKAAEALAAFIETLADRLVKL